MSGNYFKELMTKQIKNITVSKKLSYNDLKRIAKYITSSIFDENKCCLWTGYITNSNNKNKGTYINFYFRQKKVALHRLLYINFIGELSNDEYLKFSCINKGKCCNIHHMQKFQYDKRSLKLEETTSEVTIIGNDKDVLECVNETADIKKEKINEIKHKKKVDFYIVFD
jgi:hypothetical protein